MLYKMRKHVFYKKLFNVYRLVVESGYLLSFFVMVTFAFKFSKKARLVSFLP